jgi:pimeloyl-ACP methyl ester carboxylesterase
MALRLGRRGTPWIKNVVSWSPASIWDSLADGADLAKHYAVRTGWDRAGGDGSVVQERQERRREFFEQGFEPAKFLAINVMPAQPEMWWRHSWACYPSAAVGARLERQEIYDSKFRLWHWRLGAEQLLFSHQTRGADGKPLFRSNKTPMLLGCGMNDDWPFTSICSTTENTAAHMIDTPGKARFLKNTGHSIHNERPAYWTREIVRFLGM